MMAAELFIRYLVTGPSFYWWREIATPFLIKKGWHLISPSEFSYGFEPNVVRNGREVLDFDYCLQNATGVIEYHGQPTDGSIFDPLTGRTAVDDLLAFMSLYLGVYCQYLWREQRPVEGNFKASLAIRFHHDRYDAKWAGPRENALDIFERALVFIPALDTTQFQLAIRWFFSALRELELGRPLAEIALNWVCLETQSNHLGIPGNKYQKVEALLANQGFSTVPHLRNFYALRNDAFHDGQLSTLGETDAQAARTAGRALVRAQILNMIGVNHSDFSPDFVRLYA